VSLTASFLGSKVRQKLICEKLKIYKNSPNALKTIKTLKNNLKKMCIVIRIGGKMHYDFHEPSADSCSVCSENDLYIQIITYFSSQFVIICKQNASCWNIEQLATLKRKPKYLLIYSQKNNNCSRVKEIEKNKKKKIVTALVLF
jgi:threonine dehydratase